MKDRLCQYGNCEIETTTVTVNYGTRIPVERPAFCGAVHAALWLLAREGHRTLAREIEARMQVPDAVIEGNVMDFKTEAEARSGKITCVYYTKCAEGEHRCTCLEKAMLR